MDSAYKAVLIEEQKQRSLMDICEKSHPEDGSCASDAATLKDEILAVGLIEAQTVKGLIEHIWNKALTDTAAAPVLAETCHLLPTQFDPPPPERQLKEKGAGSRSSSEKKIDFRLMLIKKSKEELEKGIAARLEMKKWEEREGKSKLKGEDKEVALACRAQCVRMLNAVGFCGNLYKVGILTDKVVHSYVESLLKDAEADPRTEDAESLCSLLKLIGSKLDATSRGSRDGKTVDKWYERIAAVKDQAISKEISKMFSNVLTLRAEGWNQPAVATN